MHLLISLGYIRYQERKKEEGERERERRKEGRKKEGKIHTPSA